MPTLPMAAVRAALRGCSKHGAVARCRRTPSGSATTQNRACRDPAKCAHPIRNATVTPPPPPFGPPQSGIEVT